MDNQIVLSDEAQRIAGNVAQTLVPAIKALADAAEAIGRAFRAWFDSVWESLSPFAARLAAAMELIPRKWLRIWRHTKKRRIRKKYEKRIWAALAAAL